MAAMEKPIMVKHSRAPIAPRKIRQVCDLIRRKKASEALRILRFCEKREIAIVLTKLINSALAIASESDLYDIDNLVVKKIDVGDGPTIKRFQPRAKGRACRIRKRTGNITLELEE